MITLNEKQQLFYDKVVNGSTSKIAVLRGFAGTGKTVTLSQIIENGPFMKMLIVAPTKKALSVLSLKIPNNLPNGKKTYYDTLAAVTTFPQPYVTLFNKRFNLDAQGVEEMQKTFDKLKIPFENIVTERESLVFSDKIEYIYNSELVKARLTEKFGVGGERMIGESDVDFAFLTDEEIEENLKEYDAIFIDEMSMVSEESLDVVTRILSNFIDVADPDNSGKKLILAGDSAQLPPVNALQNKFFKSKKIDDFADEVDVVELTEILRSNDEIAKIASVIRTGVKIDNLVKTLDDSVGEYTQLTLENYINTHANELSNADVALAYKSKDVNYLNKRLRELKGFSGKSVNVNEPITVMKNTPSTGRGAKSVFANGDTVTVTKVYDIDDALKFMNYDRRLPVNRDKSAENTDLLTAKTLLEIAIESDEIRLIEVVDALEQTQFAFVPTSLTSKRQDMAWKTLKSTADDFCLMNYGKFPLVDAVFGYAHTIHKSQGSEWPNVFIWMTTKDLWIMDKQTPSNPNGLPYTGFTRAKDHAKIVVARE